MVYGNILPVSLKVTALRVIVQEECPTLTKKHALGFIYLFIFLPLALKCLNLSDTGDNLSYLC